MTLTELDGWLAQCATRRREADDRADSEAWTVWDVELDRLLDMRIAATQVVTS